MKTQHCDLGDNPLAFAHSRRKFWRNLVHEAVSVRRSLEGQQYCSLAQLADLPDEHLAAIRPLVHPGCQILVREGAVWAHLRESGQSVELFSLDNQADWVTLGMFDGKHTLEQIAARLAAAMGWGQDAAFEHARDLFFSLACQLLCFPRDPDEIPS